VGLPTGKRSLTLTVIVDDAGSGDLLFGVVIGAYREETEEFKYDVIDVRFYQDGFLSKAYLEEASRITAQLLEKLNLRSNEEIHVCQGNIFDIAVADLKEIHGEDKVTRVRVTGEAQRLVEVSYLDEVRNLGYEPMPEREEKRAKSFFHMMRWLSSNPDMLQYAKTGWPRLKRYRLFKGSQLDEVHEAMCSDCGSPCSLPFKPEPNRPVYCQLCWRKRKNRTKHNPQKNKRKSFGRNDFKKAVR
jgi:CxxC-x17-CxxC domain-containing protein